MCQRLIRLYHRYFNRYTGPISNKTLHTPKGIATVFFLEEFSDFSQYQTELKKRSSYFERRARKAEKLGYYVDTFNRANQAPDILDIRKSMKFRSFGPVLDAFFLTLKAVGGAPTAERTTREPECTKHWEICLGVFTDKPGYRQGALTMNRQLVAYARLHRSGNVVRYADFIGHGNHLKHGVMMLLQRETMRWILQKNEPTVSGIQYITYGGIEQGSEGLLFWKRKALFQPGLIEIQPSCKANYGVQGAETV